MYNHSQSILSLFFTLTFLCVFLLPRVFPPLWIEDFLFPLLLLMIFFSFGAKLKMRGEIILIFLFLFLSLFSTAIFIVDTGYVSSLLLFAKDLQYFTYYLIYFLIFSAYGNQFRVKIDRAFAFIFYMSTGFILYQLITNSIGYYGIGHISEQENSSLSGFVFFSLMFMALFFYINKRAKRFIFFSGIFFLGVLLTGSRTAQFVSIFFLFFSFIFYFRLSAIKIFSLVVFICSICIMFYNSDFIHNLLYNNSIDNQIVRSSLRRFASIFNLFQDMGSSRVVFWERQLDKFTGDNVFLLLFGGGRGFTHSVESGSLILGLGTDSGFLKAFLELGLIGGCVYYSIPFYLFVKSVRLWATSRSFVLYSGYIFSIFIYEISFENLQTSKGGMIFWLLSAYFVSLSRIRKLPKLVRNE